MDRSIYMIDHCPSTNSLPEGTTDTIRNAMGNLYAGTLYNYWTTEYAVGTGGAELISSVYAQHLDIILKHCAKYTLSPMEYRIHTIRGTKWEIINAIEDGLIALHDGMIRGPDERDIHTIYAYISVLTQIEAMDILGNTLKPDIRYAQEINAVIAQTTGQEMP